MKRTGLFITALIILLQPFYSAVSGQENAIPGSVNAANELVPNNHIIIKQGQVLDNPKAKGANTNEGYLTYSYTFSDLLIFSYEDNANISVFNSSNELIWTGILDENEFQSLSPGAGVYGVSSSGPFSLLIGDPVSHLVLGYFAMDEMGKGVSQEFLTYIPAFWFGPERLIVFGYTDNTLVEIEDLQTGEILWTGILNAEEHYITPDIENQFLHVTANHPVSVLSYTDQGYLIPDKSGDWTGTDFLGYAGFVGDWPNDLNIVSYEDNANITVSNTETGEIIWEGSLNESEIHNITLTGSSASEVFFKITSDKKITASISPYGFYSQSYAYMSDCSDYTGKRIGNLFYVPAISYGILAFNSFEDNNTITITNLNTNEVVYSNTINSGEFVSLDTENVVYKIESTGKVAGNVSCQGTAGGTFVPVYYGLDLPDLSPLAATFAVTPEEFSTGEEITLSVDIINRGSMDIYSVEVGFYDGNPINGGSQIGSIKTIETLETGSHPVTVSTTWTIPDGAEYRHIYVYVDPENKIQESSESNNLTYIPLIPNDDLIPPLAITIEAPERVDIDDDGMYYPTPFTVEAVIINDSEVNAQNVNCTLILPDGLKLADGETVTHSIGSLNMNYSMNTLWQVQVTGSNSGDLFYSVLLTADGTEDKTANRKIVVPEPAPETEVSVIWKGEKMDDAEIYIDRGEGFKHVGTTTSNDLSVIVRNLTKGTKIRAAKRLHSQAAVKVNHSDVDDNMFELWMDTDLIQDDGSYKSIEVSQTDEQLKLNLIHPVYKYNLTVTTDELDWKIDDDYLEKLTKGFKQASKLLYNATDGQAMLNKVVIYDERNNYNGADILLHNFEDGNYATLNGIDRDFSDEEIRIAKLHMHRTQTYKSHEPHENDWYHSFVHEFGHFGFGVYDEYLNGLGVKWRSYKEYKWDAGGDVHPTTYGLMQWHTDVTEFSSENDYLNEYPDEIEAQTVTKQYFKHKMSCFDYIQNKLNNYYSDIKIKLPPEGHYPDGFIYDRLGPDNDYAFNATDVVDMRGAEKSTTRNIEPSKLFVYNGDNPVKGASIYIQSGTMRNYIGKTGENGSLIWYNPIQGNTITVYAREGMSMSKKVIYMDEILPQYHIDIAEQVSTKQSVINDLKSDIANPGICISGNLAYDNDMTLIANIRLDITPDETPEAYIYYGSEVVKANIIDDGSGGNFTSELLISKEKMESSGFDGTGYLEIIYKHSSIENYATSYFKIFAISSEEPLIHYNRSFNLNIDGENMTETEFGISFTTTGVPCNESGNGLYPVSDVFGYNLENISELNETGGLNIYFEAENTAGIDLSTLGVYSQEYSSGIWNKVSNGAVSIEELTASCLTDGPALYAVMATELATDLISPERITDLEATTGSSQNMVELTWTSPIDSSQNGNHQYYIIRFNEVPITHLNWEESSDLFGEPIPSASGDQEHFKVKMTSENNLYYFAMKAVDIAGNKSELSNYTSAISAVQYYTFSLESPAFNDTVDDLQLAFEWELVEDAGVNYTLYIDTSDVFSNPTIIKDIDTSYYHLDYGLEGGNTYYWKVVALDATGDSILCNQSYYRFLSNSAVSVDEFSTGENSGSVYFYPNPFQPDRFSGTFRYQFVEQGTVQLYVYNLTGQQIFVSQIHQCKSSEESVIHWRGMDQNGSLVPSGSYFYQLVHNEGEILSGKIIVVE